MTARVTIIDDNGNSKGAYELAPSRIFEDGISTKYVFEFVYNQLNYDKSLEKEPCEDAISRDMALEKMADYVASGYADSVEDFEEYSRIICQLPSVNPQEPKTGRCKDCKWWKDNDGVYRRGVRAESKCPINRKEVYEGNGYCFMFEPQESEEQA